MIKIFGIKTAEMTISLQNAIEMSVVKLPDIDDRTLKYFTGGVHMFRAFSEMHLREC